MYLTCRDKKREGKKITEERGKKAIAGIVRDNTEQLLEIRNRTACCKYAASQAATAGRDTLTLKKIG